MIFEFFNVKKSGKNKYRFFCHWETPDINKREYCYYLFNKYDNSFFVRYKNSRKIFYEGYTPKIIDNYIQKGIWIEIPVEEAALMI